MLFAYIQEFSTNENLNLGVHIWRAWQLGSSFSLHRWQCSWEERRNPPCRPHRWNPHPGPHYSSGHPGDSLYVSPPNISSQHLLHWGECQIQPWKPCWLMCCMNYKHHLDLMFGTWFVSVRLAVVKHIAPTHVHVDRLLSDDEVKPLISEALKQTSHLPFRDWRENKSHTFLSTYTKYVNQLFSCPTRKSRVSWRQKDLTKLINKYSLKIGCVYDTIK